MRTSITRSFAQFFLTAGLLVGSFFSTSAFATYCQDWYSGYWYQCDYGGGQVTHNSGPTWANGLPQYVDDETVYYLYDPGSDKYSSSNGATIAPERLYVHFKFDQKRWVWASGADSRPIAPNSKLQGKRIGYGKGSTLALDWYRLADDWLTWQRVTDRERPIVYRWDANTQQIVVGETYPANWADLGGTLDPTTPLPTDKPSCTVTLASQSVQAKQPLAVHVTLKGSVTDVEVEGQHPAIARPPHVDAYADLTLTPQQAGQYTVTAKVTGPAGDATCSANYTVELPEAAPLSCALTVDRDEAMPGDLVIATLNSSGGVKVTAVEINGASFFNFLTRTDGSVNVQTRVPILRQNVDATGKVVIRGAVHGAKADAACSATVRVKQ